jgi:hypothetical protein
MSVRPNVPGGQYEHLNASTKGRSDKHEYQINYHPKNSPFEPPFPLFNFSLKQYLIELAKGNKASALTPNIKFSPYNFCSNETDRLNMKNINKPPIIVASA